MSDREIYTPQRVRERLKELDISAPRIDFRGLAGGESETLAGEMTAAAVLIPLTVVDGRVEAVFTKRPDTMTEHSGQVSFPGGRAEEEDQNLEETALRETHEEIGLAPGDVDVYGKLLRMPTVTGYDVAVFVGEFEQPRELTKNPREIEVIFSAPLEELDDPERHRTEQRTWRGQTFDLHFFDYDGYVIWGATGHMVHTLLEMLRGDMRSERSV